LFGGTVLNQDIHFITIFSSIILSELIDLLKDHPIKVPVLYHVKAFGS
jgi:hypothetical protein